MFNSDNPQGWYSRGYIPHLDTPGLLQFITFHLGDSLPKQTLLRLLADTQEDDADRFRRLQRLLDAGHGAYCLRRCDIAELVENALLHFDGTRYRLIGWVIMPNHVHALIETRDGHSVGGIVQSWKAFTARKANGILGRTGALWDRDYFDRYIRDDHHLAAVIRYIEQNPVKAGLAAAPEDWPYSSASQRQDG